jgi:hypothetical protein
MHGALLQHRLTFTFIEADDELCDVAVGNMLDSLDLAQRVEEALVDNNSHLLAPSTKRWNLGL